MFRILTQTVYSLLALASLAINLQAKDIPISNTLTLYVPAKEFSVLEFPFKISDKKASPFYSVAKVANPSLASSLDAADDAVHVPQLPNAKEPFKKAAGQSSKNNKTPEKKAPSPIEISVGENNIQLYPLTEGNMELVIWGYHQYPILLKIIVDVEKGEKYYNFLDYEDKRQKQNIDELESDPHREVIGKLTKALYDRKPPKGYQAESFYSKFTMNDFEFVLVQSFFGTKYIAEEWRITNLSEEATNKLYPEQFFNADIYSVSFENDVLKPKETTRMFIVRRHDVQKTNE